MAKKKQEKQVEVDPTNIPEPELGEMQDFVDALTNRLDEEFPPQPGVAAESNKEE